MNMKILAGAAALAFGALPAHALTITQTLNYGPSTTDFSSTQSFNLFDTSLGTLNSITLSDKFSYTTVMTVENQAATASSGNVRTESILTLTGGTTAQTDAISGIFATVGGDNTIDAITSPQNYSLAPGASTTINGAKTVTNAAVTSSVATYLAAFSMTGGGTGTINGSTFTQTLLGNSGGNTTSSQVTNGTGLFTIVYDYDAAPSEVPEPAMLGLFGLGAIGLGLSRRRRA